MMGKKRGWLAATLVAMLTLTACSSVNAVNRPHNKAGGR